MDPSAGSERPGSCVAGPMPDTQRTWTPWAGRRYKRLTRKVVSWLNLPSALKPAIAKQTLGHPASLPRPRGRINALGPYRGSGRIGATSVHCGRMAGYFRVMAAPRPPPASSGAGIRRARLRKICSIIHEAFDFYQGDQACDRQNHYPGMSVVGKADVPVGSGQTTEGKTRKWHSWKASISC